jgi:hypothetical protein
VSDAPQARTNLRPNLPLTGIGAKTAGNSMTIAGESPVKNKLFLVQGLAALSILGLCATAAQAMQVDVLVDKVTQHMIVKVDGVQKYDWLVSTGGQGYDTPSGNYHVFRMEKEHFSKEWDDAPMPYSMFFTGIGHAVHGSYHIKSLGRAASHGCVRLHPDNAAVLFDLIQKAGFKNNSVSIRGQTGFFQKEELLTTEQTFKMKPKDHGTSVAAVAPASTTDNRPFWWQKPAAVEQKAEAPKADKTKKGNAKKLVKKLKKGQDPKAPNFFDWLKEQKNEG